MAGRRTVAVADLIDAKAGHEHNHVGDHGIVNGIRVFGDVESSLDDAAGVREEGPRAPTPLRYSLVSMILSALIVTSRRAWILAI